MADDPAPAGPKRPRRQHLSGRHDRQPGGPTAGAFNRATMLARSLLAGEAEALTRKAVEMALGGDVVALRLCIERLVPVARHEPSLKGIDLPGMTGARDLPLLTAAILRAALDGKVALADVPAVLKIVEVTAQSISVADHDERLAALERLVTEKRLRHGN